MKQRAFEIGVAIMMFGATAMDSEGIGWIIAAGMVVAGGMISFAAQYPNKASNLTYPRKEKKNDGDFKEVLDVEIKKMESDSRPKQ